jgi:hypothetical protein
MADDVTAASTDNPLTPIAGPEPALDAGRPAGGDPAAAGPAPSPQAAQVVKAEEKQLTRDEQSLETDRVMRERREGESNRPSIEEPKPGTVRLREFEDEHLGKEAVRLNGRVERGSGSPYQALSPEKKLQYVALERLVVAEEKLADARAVVAKAEAECAMAEQHVEECTKALEPKPDAARVE